jgi:multidrug efflux pump subunit AcrB
VRVYVRLPENERGSLHDLDELILRTPQGGEIPLKMAARITSGRAYTTIKREDGRRIITVEADVEEGKANANKVMAELNKDVLPALVAAHPGLSYAVGGQQQQQAESLDALKYGFMLAQIIMFALMAIPFKSYSQPLIIMAAIPFGFVGALGGHLLMGYDLSVLSMMGLVALSGVVVNDSIVLISAINEFREQGMTRVDAVVAGGVRRFRPIMLTSLTTFFGLAPMIFETSVQARFLIPMALSLGFGVLFATFIILLIVPCLYMVLEDVKSLVGTGAAGATQTAGAPAE